MNLSDIPTAELEAELRRRNPSEDGGYETLQHAAARLGVSPVTVARWITAGKLAGLRPVGRGDRLALSLDVDAMLAERKAALSATEAP